MTPAVPPASAKDNSIGVGVIGLGFMGQTHVRAYQNAAAEGFGCRLVAVCDADTDRRAGRVAATGNIAALAEPKQLFDPRVVHGYSTPGELLADPAVLLVSICTYTESHVELALAALAAGKHVLVEKPVSLRSAEVRRLAQAANRARDDRGLLCMPAMCMRFWPGWDWLRERVVDGSLGRVRSATFTRMGSGPAWASGFYRDTARSGGALFDLHIHDTDFVYWCFGRPRSVCSTGDQLHVSTLYRYEDAGSPVHVVAEGAWDLAPGAGFRMRFVVNFERATAEFDLARAPLSPALVLHTAEGTSAVEPTVPGIATGYDGEVRHLLSAITSGSRELGATLDDAAAVATVLEAEQESQRTGGAVAIRA